VAKAMIVTVGSTPAPLIKALCEYRPEFVSFFVSQGTAAAVVEITRAVTDTGLVFKSEMTITDNVNDLLHCHEKAGEAVQRVLRKGYARDEVIVDYTGGTKNMSVALSLASISHGFVFSYVGGDERTKNGMGVVMDGQERVYESVNPWDFLAVEERKKISLLFNQHQFQAALDLMETLIQKGPKQKALYRRVRSLIEGYLKWDLFRHDEALGSFKKGNTGEIQEYGDKPIADFAKRTDELIPFLEKIVGAGKKPSAFHILDLFANAQRRSYEGRIDDAILRLYRLVEMLAQERLLNTYSIDVSNVRPDCIPDSLKPEYEARYKSERDGRIQIPQAAAFRLLREKGDPLGIAYGLHHGKFLDIQTSRNTSYLAHGFGSSKGKTYENLKEFVLGLGVFSADQAPLFPRLEI
jgi:CRISPR-associated protein (TIGR02710 family)